MRNRKIVLSVLVVLALSPSAYPAPEVSGLVNARSETRASSGSLERDVKALLAARGDRFWMAYSVPAKDKHRSCCWSSSSDESGCGGCRLEGDKGEGSFRTNRSEPLPLEASYRVRVLLRGEGGRVTRVRTVSEDCGLDAGGLSFVWIEGVRPADSVAFLSSLLGSSGEPGKGLGDGVLSAIAFTDDPAADAALDRFVAQDQPEHRRKQAAFWMGQARGARGFTTLSRLVRTDPSPQFREHVVFALTQSHEAGAIDRIIDVAKHDESGHVRGQALFWLAQSASRRAPAAIQAALTDDPEIEVKKKAVFAVSQLPKDEGVPLLIRLAETHKSVEVRKQAMFWLGQSEDPRALQFFEAVLKR